MGCGSLTYPIIEALFEYSTRAIRSQRTKLIEENAKLTGNMEGFLYGGIFHTEIPSRAIKQANKKIIHTSLRPAARRLLASKERYDKELLRAHSGLLGLLRDCKTHQDARDLLPDTLVAVCPPLRKRSRTREPGFLYKDSPIAMNNYQLIIELLEEHASNQIL